jgi:hypothetical protein
MAIPEDQFLIPSPVFPVNVPVASGDPPLSIHREQITLFRERRESIFLVQIPESLSDPARLHIFLQEALMSGSDLISATFIESRPDQLVVEADSIDAVLSLFHHRIPESAIRLLPDRKSLIANFCNPLRCARFRPGLIVRLNDPEFLDDAAQIVDIDPIACEVTVKLFPHIDYKNMMVLGIWSQRALNLQMPPEYHAPVDQFRHSFLRRKGAQFGMGSLRLSQAPGGSVDMLSWDGDLYQEPFMYVPDIPLSAVVSEGINLTDEEFARFSNGIQSDPFNIDPQFIMRMERAKPLHQGSTKRPERPEQNPVGMDRRIKPDVLPQRFGQTGPPLVPTWGSPGKRAGSPVRYDRTFPEPLPRRNDDLVPQKVVNETRY